jgi:ABC-type Fe3+/spermidine/putrescine transport system ATPase subunit
MKALRLENITKMYENELVVDNLSLEIPPGQFFALLGPSGCGKTTVLRLIAGFESADSGNIFLGHKDITHAPPHLRSVNTVFQNYALFPHLSVFENIAYGPQIKGLTEPEVYDLVTSLIKTVRLEGLGHKMPSQLSGGQQQRVAIARALAREPDILLLDEPLAALDQRLKEEVLLELIELQERVGTTFVYVTHDQNEALTVASRIAIMNTHGRVEQLSSPKNIYEFPASRFVANFVGTANIIQGTLYRDDEYFDVATEELGNISILTLQRKNWMIAGCHVFISIRPEKIRISKHELNGFANSFTGTVHNVIYQGSVTRYEVTIPSGRVLTILKQNSEHIPQEVISHNDSVFLYFHREDAILLEN